MPRHVTATEQVLNKAQRQSLKGDMKLTNLLLLGDKLNFDFTEDADQCPTNLFLISSTFLHPPKLYRFMFSPN